MLKRKYILLTGVEIISDILFNVIDEKSSSIFLGINVMNFIRYTTYVLRPA